MKTSRDIKEILTPWIGSIVLLPLCLYLAVNRGDFIFLIDHFNLLIHEGGHGIFRIFGEFIYTLGGTLMQIILPSIFIFYFFINKKKIGMQISIVWLAQNLMNIAVYAADARARKLPLLGGNNVYHDWTWLLGRTSMLQHDILIGEIFYYTGIACLIIALLVPLFMKEYKQVKLDLKL